MSIMKNERIPPETERMNEIGPPPKIAERMHFAIRTEKADFGLKV